MYSGTEATRLADDAGVATVTSPAPDRRAPSPAKRAAPVLPGDPATNTTWPQSPLCASRARTGIRDRTCSGVSSSSRGPSRSSITHAGIPISATTSSPARSAAGASTSGIFGAARVTVTRARMHAPRTCGVSAETPEGRSMDTTGRPVPVDVGDDRLEKPRERSRQARADEGVDDEVTHGHLWTVSLPRRRVRNLFHRHAKPSHDVKVCARIPMNISHPTGQEDGPPRGRVAPSRVPPRTRRRRCCRARRAPPRATTQGLHMMPRSRRRLAAPRSPWSTMDGMPISSIVRRSAARICAASSTRMIGDL